MPIAPLNDRNTRMLKIERFDAIDGRNFAGREGDRGFFQSFRAAFFLQGRGNAGRRTA